jgi:preprotein translocase subunit Sss1
VLSHNDRRRLEAIEQQLRHEDPELVHRLTRSPSSPERGRARRTAIGTIILGALGALLGLMLFSPALFVLSTATALGSWAWLSHPGPSYPR